MRTLARIDCWANLVGFMHRLYLSSEPVLVHLAPLAGVLLGLGVRWSESAGLLVHLEAVGEQANLVGLPDCILVGVHLILI